MNRREAAKVLRSLGACKHGMRRFNRGRVWGSDIIWLVDQLWFRSRVYREPNGYPFFVAEVLLAAGAMDDHWRVLDTRAFTWLLCKRSSFRVTPDLLKYVERLR